MPHMSSGKGFLRGGVVVSSLTLLSRLTGLARDAICSRLFGASIHWDAFSVAFAVPNLFRRLFGEGALSAAFIPIYSELLHRDPSAARNFARTVVSGLIVLLAAVVLIGELLLWLVIGNLASTRRGELAVTLAAIMLPYVVMVCVVAILGGVLNVAKHFAAPAAAPIVLNLCIIAAAIVAARLLKLGLHRQIILVASAVLLAGGLQVCLQVPALRRAGFSFRPVLQIGSEPFRRMVRFMLPMLVGLSAVQLNALLDQLLALWLSHTAGKGPHLQLFGRALSYPMTEGANSVLYFAQRLYHFPLGVFGLAIATAIYPYLSSAAARNRIGELKATLERGVRLAFFVGLPASVGLILVRRELIEVILQGGRFSGADTLRTADVLLWYAAGVWAYCMTPVLVRGYYALGDSITPVKVAGAMVALNLVLNLVLVWQMAESAFALSTATCAVIGGVLLAWRLAKRGFVSLGNITRPALSMVLATAAMSAAGVLLRYLLADGPAWLRLASVVGLCVVIYITAARLLRIAELSETFSALRRKKP